jgi:hypothetical protein
VPGLRSSSSDMVACIGGKVTHPEIERWRAIPGWSPYLASDHGRIGVIRGRQFIIKSIITNQMSGDLFSTFFRDRSIHTVNIKALIALAWLGPTPPGFQVRIKDKDKHNLCLDNLEFVTQSEISLSNSKTRRPRIMPRRMTRQERKELIDLWRHGISQLRLAKWFPMTNSGISRLLKREKVERTLCATPRPAPGACEGVRTYF